MQSYPVLLPMTPEARDAMGKDAVMIDKIPFRFGRECRPVNIVASVMYKERRKKGLKPNNDLYMFDRGNVLNISREHFQIEKKVDGSYEMVDRGSACGTIVDDKLIGGNDRSGRCSLGDENIIVVGTRESPFVYKFQLSSG